MNGKQAARAAAKRIEELEITCARMMADIKRYNQVIDSMIAGGNPCEFCEDLKECQLEARGKGCDLWMLSYEDDQDPTEFGENTLLMTAKLDGSESEE